jgi:hypothetical protein
MKAYANDLKDFWELAGFRGLDWREARLEDVRELLRGLSCPGSASAPTPALQTCQKTATATINASLRHPPVESHPTAS